jgi:LmbE family N-acetylglucosaminyl deacetylase
MSDPLSEVEFSTVLVVCAHPDDGEFSAGGAMAKWAAEGKEVVLCVISNGAMGSNNPDFPREELIVVREREQRAAAAVAGLKDVVFLGYEDGYLSDSHEIRRDIIREMRRLKADVVVGPDPSTFYQEGRYVNHPDHRAAGMAFAAAVNPGASTTPLYRAELYDQGFLPYNIKACLFATTTKPDYYVDISGYIDTKIAALKEHHSQIGAHQGFDERVRQMARQTAERSGSGYAYAEAFKGFFFEQRPTGQTT